MARNGVVDHQPHSVSMIRNGVRTENDAGLFTVVDILISQKRRAAYLNLIGSEPEREGEVAIFTELKRVGSAEIDGIRVLHRKGETDSAICGVFARNEPVVTGEITNSRLDVFLEGKIGDQTVGQHALFDRSRIINFRVEIFWDFPGKVLHNVGGGIAVPRIPFHQPFGNVFCRDDKGNSVTVLRADNSVGTPDPAVIRVKDDQPVFAGKVRTIFDCFKNLADHSVDLFNVVHVFRTCYGETVTMAVGVDSVIVDHEQINIISFGPL